MHLVRGLHAVARPCDLLGSSLYYLLIGCFGAFVSVFAHWEDQQISKFERNFNL